MHEALTHDRNTYVTLTYNDQMLPRSGSVELRDWQLFAKRLRKHQGPFRFFTCAEYSPKLRPHFHSCLFGLAFDDLVDTGERSNNRPVITSPTLEKIWGNGFVSVGNLCYQTANYVARYILKRKTGDNGSSYLRIDHENELCFEVSPEFATMSKNPGIGATWLKKFQGDVYPSDECIHQGKRFRPPRFYDDYYKKFQPDDFEKIQRKRRQKVLKRQNELTPDELKNREKIDLHNLKRYKQDKNK